MASEYLQWKARNETREAPRVLTPKEKLQNWWYYHWYWVAIGAVILCVVGTMAVNALGIGKTKPDYVFAYIGANVLPDEQAAAFEAALATLGTDRNGDGQVTVELRQYGTNRTGDPELALYYNYAADTQLLADVTKGESYFFIMEDPDAVQRAYQILANDDGTPPDEWDYAADSKVYAWHNCPALASLPIDQEAYSGLFLGRRCFYGSAANGHDGDAALWNVLTKGATR